MFHYTEMPGRRWQFTVPAFQGLPGCTRGSVLNRLITHQGRRGGLNAVAISLSIRVYAGAQSAQWQFPGLRVTRQSGRSDVAQRVILRKSSPLSIGNPIG